VGRDRRLLYDFLRLPDGSSIPLKVLPRPWADTLAPRRAVISQIRPSSPLRRDCAVLEHHPASCRHGRLQPAADDAKPSVLLALFYEGAAPPHPGPRSDSRMFLGLTASALFPATTWRQPVILDGLAGVPVATCRRIHTAGRTELDWRGPVWFPRSLMLSGLCCALHDFGYEFTVECPVGSGRHCNLYQVSRDRRPDDATFTRIPADAGPVHGGHRCSITTRTARSRLFYEYYARGQRADRAITRPLCGVVECFPAVPEH